MRRVSFIPRDDTKFRELILYISQQCAPHIRFGSTKLNKILYYSDFSHYAYHGESITGQDYQRLANGPAPRRLVVVRDKMIAEGILGMQPLVFPNGVTQKRPINLRQPNLKVFSGTEIAVVDRVIDALEPLNADETSRLSHEMIGWISAVEGETIPYSSVFVSNEPLTDAELVRGRQIAQAAKAPSHH